MEHLLTSKFSLCVLFFICFAATGSDCSLILPSPPDFESVYLCITEITKKYTERRTFIFLTEEIQGSDFGFKLLHLLDGPREIVALQNISNQEGFFIFIAHRNRFYSKILESLTSVDNSRFLVIWLQPETNLLHVRSVFEEFWRFEFLDVIALVQMRYGGLSLYTYYPYTNTRCGDSGPPVLLDTWSPKNNTFTRKKELFERYKKVYNLHGCALQCSGAHRPPDSIIEKMDNSSYNYSGVGGLLFKFISNHMNFTPVINRITDTTSNYESSYANDSSIIAIDVASRRVDLGFGKFSRLLDLHPKVSFVKETSMDCFTWAVPSSAGVAPSMWTTYIGEFSGVTWMLIIFHLVMVIFVFRWLSCALPGEDHTFSDWVFLSFFIFNTFLGAPVEEKPRTNRVRTFFAPWLLYCLVLGAAYQASLGSFATVPTKVANIEHTDELLETKFSITGGPQMFYVLNASTDTSDAIKQLLQRFEVLPPGEFLPVMKRVVERRDVAVFATKGLLSYSNRKLRQRNMSTSYLQQECVIKSPSSPIIVRRVSPLFEPLSLITGRLFEAGILTLWESTGRDDDGPDMVHSEPKLYLEQMQGAFNLLITGLIMSTVAFVAEMIYHKWINPPADLLTQLVKEGYNIQFLR